MGDAFFKYVFNHQYQDARVCRIDVTPSDDDEGDSRSCQRTHLIETTGNSWQSRWSQMR